MNTDGIQSWVHTSSISDSSCTQAAPAAILINYPGFLITVSLVHVSAEMLKPLTCMIGNGK